MRKIFSSQVMQAKSSILPLLITVLAFSVSCNTQESGFEVMKGNFRQSVNETGELQALNASFLSMPKINYIYGYNFKIVGLAEHGKNVRKGEPVITVDPSSVQKYIIEKRELLENEIASSNKLKAEMVNKMQDLKAKLMNEQASYNIKKLQKEGSAFESRGIRQVLELEFRQAEIRLNKLKRTLELTPKLDSLDLRIQQIKIKQRENEVKAAEETLRQLVVNSPLDGIFVVEENWRTGQTIKIGDEVFLGAPVARIPDIRTMKVKGFINENDISKIHSGQNVIIRLDALQSIPFKGRIVSVGKVCIKKDEKKIFPTEVLITDSDPRLKPGMTVRCEYITYESGDDLYVPTSCLLEENRHFYLYAWQKRKLRKIEVKTGPSNNYYTIVDGDITPGQKIENPENLITKNTSGHAN